MSERASGDSKGQQTTQVSESEAREHLDRIAQKLKSDAESAADKAINSDEHLDVRKLVEQEALPGSEIAGKHERLPRDASQEALYANYKKTIHHIEDQLAARERMFSRIINSQTIDHISNIAGKTVARPSGLLGGSVISFAALLFIALLANRYGWQVGGTEFVVFFVLGWMAGIVLELLIKILRRARR